MLKALYICPFIPKNEGSGGNKAAYNHLSEIVQTLDIDLVLIDVEKELSSKRLEIFGNSAYVFNRSILKYSSSYSIIQALKQLLFDVLPRSASVINSIEARTHLKKLFNHETYNFIIIDHINAYSLIESMDISTPIYYIAHNIEQQIIIDKIKTIGKNIFSYIFHHIEYHKMKRLENRLFRIAKKIICLSIYDSKSSLLMQYYNKTRNVSELRKNKNEWSLNGEKSLLFVGTAKYYPNKEAIEWIVNELMPDLYRLDDKIFVNIVCHTIEGLNLLFDKNIRFHPYLSIEALESIHLDSSIFISPVILGSGIKMKIVDALSYSMPILATSESLLGFNIFEGSKSMMLSRNSSKDAIKIKNILDDSGQLKELAYQNKIILKKELENNNNLAEIIIS